MRMSRTILILCLVVAVATAQKPEPHYAVLEPGEFHGDDVALQQPVDWLGVYCVASRCDSRPVKVHTKRVPDPLGEDEPQRPTGTAVEVSPRNTPLFLVHGLSTSARPVPTVFHGDKNFVTNDAQQFAWHGHTYTLKVFGTPTEEEPLPKGSRLVWSDGSISQALYTLPDEANDPHVALFWIGDVDGDGKPDLYIDASSNYNVLNKELWLSSLAKSGQLVGRAGAFTITGC